MEKRHRYLVLLLLLIVAFLPTFTAPDRGPTEVEVVNFPEPQRVSGTVTVAGAANSLPIHGTVSVDAIPPVTGTVSVNNFPASVAVSGTVGVDSLPPVSGAVSVENLPAVQEVSGQVAVANLPLDAEGNLRVAPTKRPFRFVGVTSQRFDGSVGYGTMTRACYDEYQGRMAFTDEYRTTLNPTVVQEPAWIAARPVLINRGETFFVDRAGVLIGIGGYDCNGWRQTAGHGLALYPTGIPSAKSCAEFGPIACAAP